MALCFYLLIILVTANGVFQADAESLNRALQRFAKYIEISLKDVPEEILHEPQNTNSSIQYLLFTPDQPKNPCFLEPNQDALNRCPFDKSLQLKILVHGFLDRIHRMGRFLEVKDEFLKYFKYNVIVVDWGKYNQPPYFAAAINSIIVGRRLASLIKYLQTHADLDSKLIHLIGHSMGAHSSGVAGSIVPNISRITGLDPAYRLYYQVDFLHRLSYSDASFVDIIHSSNHTAGLAESEPKGDLDFYPNGGNTQPECNNEPDDAVFSKRRFCNHRASIDYFHQSIDISKCRFLASNCNNYTNFLQGLCPNESSPMAEMGLPAEPIPGLPVKSKFYLRTSADSPYCLQDGYEVSKRMRPTRG